MFRIIAVFVLAGFLIQGCTEPKAPVPESEKLFVFVRIPEAIMPLERGEKYEEPLDARLKAGGHGEVTGGGTQMGAKKADGTREIEWIGIDVEMVNADASLAALREELMKLNAPRGTVLEYSRNGESVEEKLWQ